MFWSGFLRIIFALLIVFGVVSCGTFQSPPRSVVKEALSLQLQMTEISIANSMDLEPNGVPRIKSLKVEHSDDLSLKTSEEPIIRLTGFIALELPGDSSTKKRFFELFLEKGLKGESWRLARPIGPPDGGSQEWVTYALPIQGA